MKMSMGEGKSEFSSPLGASSGTGRGYKIIYVVRVNEYGMTHMHTHLGNPWRIVVFGGHARGVPMQRPTDARVVFSWLQGLVYQSCYFARVTDEVGSGHFIGHCC